MRLKEVGVNISFFLPRRVVSLTSGDEFHSLKATAKPRNRSHCESKAICVDLPEPSIPSTTINRPGPRLGKKEGTKVPYDNERGCDASVNNALQPQAH
jgi:hypothetical protein